MKTFDHHLQSKEIKANQPILELIEFAILSDEQYTVLGSATNTEGQYVGEPYTDMFGE